MKYLSFFIFMLATAAACKHTQYTADNLPAEQLRWGSGGGFVGSENMYILLENGQIFQRANRGEAPHVAGATKPKTADKLQDEAEDLHLHDMNFSHPGNMYYFIEFEDDGKTGRVVWGDANVKVDPKVQALYDKLSQLLPVVKRDE